MKAGIVKLHPAVQRAVPEASTATDGFAWPTASVSGSTPAMGSARPASDGASPRVERNAVLDGSDFAAQTGRSIFERGAPSARADRHATSAARPRSDGPSRDARNVAAVLGVVSAVEMLDGDTESSLDLTGVAARLASTVPLAAPAQASVRDEMPPASRPDRRTPVESVAAQSTGVARLEMSATPGGSAASVELRHPTLGTIGLEIRIDRDRMVVVATTRSSAAACAVTSGLDSLRQALRRSGLVLADFRTRVARPTYDETLFDEEDAP